MSKAKARVKTYSMEELQARASLSGQEAETGAGVLSDKGALGELAGSSGMDDVDFEKGEQGADRGVGWDLSRLPNGARVVGFEQVAMELACDRRGFALLSGMERSAAGLDVFRVISWDAAIGAAFSFCVNGKTYTAFENPDDSYRSSMSSLVEQEGNKCSTTMDAVALRPQFRRFMVDEDQWREMEPMTAGSETSDMLCLVNPSTQEMVLSVGTNLSESYYPSFVAHCDVEALGRAALLGIALAYGLDEEGLEAKKNAGVSRRRL